LTVSHALIILIAVAPQTKYYSLLYHNQKGSSFLHPSETYATIILVFLERKQRVKTESCYRLRQCRYDEMMATTYNGMQVGILRMDIV